MSDWKARNSTSESQRIPRIEPREAEKVFKRCDQILSPSAGLISAPRQFDFSSLLALLDDDTLQLSVQPDAWGERARARLISAILAGMAERPRLENIKEITRISNIVMPCFLLELGRRKQHVQVAFPRDPTEHDSQFRLSVGPSYTVHVLSNVQLMQLVSQVGEELVGLCYFGDEQSRQRVAMELSLSVETRSSSVQ